MQLRLVALFEPKLQVAYVLGLAPMALGLYIGFFVAPTDADAALLAAQGVTPQAWRTVGDSRTDSAMADWLHHNDHEDRKAHKVFWFS